MRQSGVPFVVVRPCALTEEPAGAELQLSQGDTIKVQHAKDIATKQQSRVVLVTGFCYKSITASNCIAPE